MSTSHPAVPTMVFWGHALLTVTGIMYSVYWILDYYDVSRKYSPVAWSLFSLSIVVGFIGLFFFYVSSVDLLMPARTQNGPVILTGIALFVVSLVVMHVVFGRPFTSEIFFAFLWAVSEMNILWSLRSAGCVGKGPFYVMAAGVILCTAVNLVTYRVHLELRDFKRFMNGLVPYLVNILFNMAVLVFLFFNGSRNGR